MDSKTIIFGLLVGGLLLLIPLIFWYVHQQRKKLTEQHHRDVQSLDAQLERGDLPPEIYERLRTQLNEQFRKQLKKAGK